MALSNKVTAYKDKYGNLHATQKAADESTASLRILDLSSRLSRASSKAGIVNLLTLASWMKENPEIARKALNYPLSDAEAAAVGSTWRKPKVPTLVNNPDKIGHMVVPDDTTPDGTQS